MEVILVLNSGSSSLKYKLFEMEEERVLASGNVEKIGFCHLGNGGEGAKGGNGNGNSLLTHKVEGREPYRYEEPIPDHKRALERVLAVLQDPQVGVLGSLAEIKAVGHRVLHGKDAFADSVVVTPQVRAQLEGFRELGPLHMPANLMGIDACRELMPGVPQVAVFDTAFHQTMPPYAYTYSLPYEIAEKYGIRKYGFHGISHKYVANRTAQLLGRQLSELRLVTLHLGNGCSLAAVKNGRCVDTTMGFTPLEGLTMGTRSGDLDPAVIPVLCEKLGLSPREVDNLLNKESGLLGISGISSDMRDIEAGRNAGDKRAQLAFAIFNYRVAKYVGAYFVVMGGIDVLSFTAGIGENMASVRAEVCQWLAPLGVELDPELNQAMRGKEGRISTPGSKITVLVTPTNEELMIARDTRRLVG